MKEQDKLYDLFKSLGHIEEVQNPNPNPILSLNDIVRLREEVSTTRYLHLVFFHFFLNYRSQNFVKLVRKTDMRYGFGGVIIPTTVMHLASVVENLTTKGMLKSRYGPGAADYRTLMVKSTAELLYDWESLENALGQKFLIPKKKNVLVSWI